MGSKINRNLRAGRKIEQIGTKINAKKFIFSLPHASQGVVRRQYIPAGRKEFPPGHKAKSSCSGVPERDR